MIDNSVFCILYVQLDMQLKMLNLQYIDNFILPLGDPIVNTEYRIQN